MRQLGRNDPCHCGSGKKYKKCHLEADERNRTFIRPREPESEPPSESASGSESPRAFADVRNLPNLLRQLSERGSAADRKEFRKLLSQTETVFQYMGRQSEIEAAAATLEAHRSDFDKLVADEARYVALARSVFSQECFAPLRFRASDVQKAFDRVGYPAMMSHDDRTVQTLRAAILHIADKTRRSDLSMRLLMQLPEFVAAGRYLEAWLLHSEALQTTEEADESNPFLFEMFSYGAQCTQVTGARGCTLPFIASSRNPTVGDALKRGPRGTGLRSRNTVRGDR